MAPSNPEELARFLSDATKAPDLERAVQAFRAGNYRLVREETARVLATSTDESIRATALELRQRTEPDPLVRYLLAASFVLLAIVTIFAYLH